jgi:hypothetical protein
MTDHLPHDPYMDLVHAALADLGMTPSGFRTSDDDEELDATFEFPDHSVSDDEWPDGVYLSWTRSDGWTLTDRGASRTSYPLGVGQFGSPAAVAATTRARLAGRADLVGIGRSEDWDLRGPISEAVSAWA